MSQSNQRIWYTRCPVPTALGLAVQLGNLQKDLNENGIEFQSLSASNSKTVRQSHFEQTQPFSLRHGGNIPPLISISRGAKIRIVGMSWLEQRQYILVPQDSELFQPKDLKGTRIGVPRRVNETNDFWRASTVRGVDAALLKVGLDLSDVELVDLPVEERWTDYQKDNSSAHDSLWGAKSAHSLYRREVFAFINKEIDAIFSYGSHAVEAQRILGARILLDLGLEKDYSMIFNNSEPLIFTMSEDLITKQPDIADRIIAHSYAAISWAKNHRESFNRIIARESMLPEELVEDAYTNDLYRQLDFDFSEAKISALQLQKDFLFSHGFIERNFELKRYIDLERIHAAKKLVDNKTINLPQDKIVN